MFKHFSWREIVLVGTPLLLIGGVFGWKAWQNRFRTSRIALSVHLDHPVWASNDAYGNSPEGSLSFVLNANVSGGPRSGYRFGWNESLVAKTQRGMVALWKFPSTPVISSATNATGGGYGTTYLNVTFSARQSTNQFIQTRDYDLSSAGLPIDVQGLEWRGDIVVIPTSNTSIWDSPLTARTLQSWARKPGAASWHRTLSLDYDPQKLGAVVLRKKNGASKVQFHVEVATRKGDWRSFRRLVAFDGTTHRVLWTDAEDLNRNGVCRDMGHFVYLAPQGQLARDSERFEFDVSKAPSVWGEVSFLCDTVYDLSKSTSSVPRDKARLSEQGLDAFQRRTKGWRVSRRLVIRP